MEENYEKESDQILVYGNITSELFGEIKKFTYLCGKYTE